MLYIEDNNNDVVSFSVKAPANPQSLRGWQETFYAIYAFIHSYIMIMLMKTNKYK